MKKDYFIVIAFVLATILLASTNSPNDILGIWATENKEYKILIYKKGALYSGKIIGGKNIYESDGNKLRRDIHNQKEELRHRTFIHLDLFKNFMYENRSWKNGEVYDPETGFSYSSILQLNLNRLEVKTQSGKCYFLTRP